MDTPMLTWMETLLIGTAHEGDILAWGFQ